MSYPKGLLTHFLLVCCTFVIFSPEAHAQGQPAQDVLLDITPIDTLTSPPDERWYTPLEKVSFNNTLIRDILQGIAIQNGLNIVVDDQVQERVTLYFQEVPIWDLITYLTTNYDLTLDWQGTILMVSKPVIELDTPEERSSLNVALEDSLISIFADNAPIQRVATALTNETGVNVLVDQTLTMPVNGMLKRVALVEGLQIFFQYNGLQLRKQGNVLYVSRPLQQPEQGPAASNQWVSVVDDTVISLELFNAPIQGVIQQIAEQSGLSIINYAQIPGSITARTTNLPLDQTLNLLLQNTEFTYREDGEMFLIGQSTMEGMTTRELIKLKHLKSSGVIPLFPQSISGRAEIIEVKELNSIMVIGNKKVVDAARDFVSEIDHLVPQILIEALVVDYQISNMDEFKVEFGIDPDKNQSAIQLYPFLEGTVTKDEVSNLFPKETPPFISKNIGYLPDNFYATVKAMEQDGYAKIQSKPHISTLNGNKASLVIATTQYFIFESEVLIPTTGNPTTQTSQRFEQVKAEIRLEITPWVSADGEITTEIHPEFSTPVGNFDPEIPPTINSRIFDSTVRLRDGETIILGGLIQNDRSNTRGKFPILGDLPLLGFLFRNHSRTQATSELVIYLTPHLNMEPVNIDEYELEQLGPEIPEPDGTEE